MRYITYNCIILDDFFIVKTQKLIFFTNYKDYYLGDNTSSLKSHKEEVHWDITSQSLTVYQNKDIERIKFCNILAKKFIWKSGLFYFAKMRFSGKGYKVKKTKKKRSFKFYFGKSHISYVFSGGLIFKKLSKFRLFFISNNKKRINRIKKMVILVRPINRFTKRGLRFTKQFILKRPGKKTNY